MAVASMDGESGASSEAHPSATYPGFVAYPRVQDHPPRSEALLAKSELRL